MIKTSIEQIKWIQKKEKPAYLIQHETATKSRQDKSNNKIIYLNPCILVILTDVNGLNILIQRKRLSD